MENDMSIFLNSLALRAFWDEHPTWVLRLTVRNFNWVQKKGGEDDITRPSVHAVLSESLVSDYNEDRYVEEGLHFDLFFGSDFAQYFEGGVFPTERHSSGFALGSGKDSVMVGDLDIASFATTYTQHIGRTIMVIHQEGGDPENATFTVHGYWRGGVNACDVFREAANASISFSSITSAMHHKLGMALMYLGAEHNWEQFERVGALYVRGAKLSPRWVKYFQSLGFAGVRNMLVPAEKVLGEQFPEFLEMPHGTASVHLI